MKEQHYRRKILVGGLSTASLGIAGCLSSSPTDDSSGDLGEPQWEEVLNTRVEVLEDDYQSWSWAPDQDVQLRWDMTVRDGPSVELFMLESTEFDEYQAGNRFYSVKRESGKSGSSTFTLEDGNYRVVLDNTNAGNINPPTNFDDDGAEVEIEAEAKRA